MNSNFVFLALGFPHFSTLFMLSVDRNEFWQFLLEKLK